MESRKDPMGKIGCAAGQSRQIDPPKSSNCGRYTKGVVAMGKKFILLGYRKESSEDEMEVLYEKFENNGESGTAEKLLNRIDVESIKYQKRQQAA